MILSALLEPLLTVGDLERLLRVDKRTIARLCKRSQLPPPVKVGGSNRWRMRDLALAATGALMILLGVVHPPAGATTLIISLGFITTPAHLGVIEIAVALLALQALASNRLVGIDYPLWSRNTVIFASWSPHGKPTSSRG